MSEALNDWESIIAHKRELAKGEHWVFVAYGKSGAASVMAISKCLTQLELEYKHFGFRLHIRTKKLPQIPVAWLTVPKGDNQELSDLLDSVLKERNASDPIYVFHELEKFPDGNVGVSQKHNLVVECVHNFIHGDEDAYRTITHNPEWN